MGLLEITKLPTAENAVDSSERSRQRRDRARCAVAGPGAAIERARAAVSRIRSRRDTRWPSQPIGAGENVLRYGQVIGRARMRIEPGRHVHTHNLAFEELSFDYEFPDREAALAACSLKNVADVSGLSARGRPRRDAQLHRGGCGEQLRRAHRRADRCELRRRIACRPTWTAWRRSRTARAAATPSARTPSSCSGRSRACWIIPTSRPRSFSAWAAK